MCIGCTLDGTTNARDSDSNWRVTGEESDDDGTSCSELEDDPPSRRNRYVYIQTHSYTTPSSTISDAELDVQILDIRSHFPLAGITMLHGALQSRDLHIPRRRIQESLLRVDPVRRVFGRLNIQRRKYSVPGPNSLWHHDGQHGK